MEAKFTDRILREPGKKIMTDENGVPHVVMIRDDPANVVDAGTPITAADLNGIIEFADTKADRNHVHSDVATKEYVDTSTHTVSKEYIGNLDWDTFTTPGLFWINNNNAGANRPEGADHWGVLEVAKINSGSGQELQQIYRGASGPIYKRFRQWIDGTTAWFPWVEGATKEYAEAYTDNSKLAVWQSSNLGFGSGTTVGAYNSPGVYYFPNTATGVGTPNSEGLTTHKYGYLEVIGHYMGMHNDIVQRFTDLDGDTWVRYISGVVPTWSSWKKLTN